jgi:transposase
MMPKASLGWASFWPKPQRSGPGVKCTVIVEASGGNEAALVEALQEAGQRVSVVQPGRVRHFARAKNQHAKSDPIEAQVLAALGEAIQSAATPAPSAAQKRLAALVGRRQQLVQYGVCSIWIA